ncbi:sulfotransferase family 2 domain-containing protein [Desulfogranum marinum]|uniref:sulfotransferase family 2 domain-containing protein n=1 Tax=Desulfogranum marinum TaxID=453220 RepID=UPI001963EB8E|nr:sulfotransferase family 2 domain-containing protein [Desulfogranum marinum]MBM9514820.1 sulfotransferase family 2 domain-containing protein [Desulfogranum marinum]
MISHKHKCIFIHIPKCAGTSIEKTFGHFEEYSGYYKQDHRSIRMIEPIYSNVFASKENSMEFLKRLWIHIKPPSNPRNRYSVSRDQYENYFKFTFVRNPWARAYSWYKNVMRDHLHLKKMRISNEISLYDFLERFKNKTALRAQTFWIKNSNGDIPLDYIGRFENLDNDFEKICNLMKIEPLKLPHELKGAANSSHQDAYDSKTIDLISSIYREEIELFGYSFDS